MTKHSNRQSVWYQSAADFFFLQNRLFPRAASLEWVGNRHQLSSRERQILNRGVFGQKEALQRRGKRCRGCDWRKEPLVVDGHNVQITVESALLDRPLLLANDGAMRDLAGQSARFRISEVSEIALDAIFRFLDMFRPHNVLFLFDAPMSQSGYLASLYRKRLQGMGLSGDARTAPVPEREIPYDECVVATSDRAVLDRTPKWLDLARWTIDAFGLAQPLVDFSHLTCTRPFVQ